MFQTLKARHALVLSTLGGLTLSAQAAVPEAFTTAVGAATTDAVAMASALLGVAAGVVVVMIALKFVKRIKSAA